MLERDVAREVFAYLSGTLGLMVLRADPRGKTRWTRPNSAGMPDFYGILPNGRWWACECKATDARGLKPGTKGRKNEAKQNEVREHLARNGALYIVASSVADVHQRLNPDVLRRHAMQTAQLLAEMEAELRAHAYAKHVSTRARRGAMTDIYMLLAYCPKCEKDWMRDGNEIRQACDCQFTHGDVCVIYKGEKKFYPDNPGPLRIPKNVLAAHAALRAERDEGAGQ